MVIFYGARQVTSPGSAMGTAAGRSLVSMIAMADASATSWGDKFISVEHLVFAFCKAWSFTPETPAVQDTRYGQRFFSEFGCDEARLKAAIDDVRGTSKAAGRLQVAISL